jgi:hypothetical protein
LGKAEGILHADDTYLFTTRADKANLIDVDALIDSWFVVNGCSSTYSSTCAHGVLPKEHTNPYRMRGWTVRPGTARHPGGISPLAFRLFRRSVG